MAEATANITKLFSGTLSDRMGRRKPLAALGYGLGAASKPLFALANSVGWVMVARFTDRIGKGVRGAPRDALLADVSPRELRGASFGAPSLDTVGAFLGPLAAFTLMSVTGDAFRTVSFSLWRARGRGRHGTRRGAAVLGLGRGSNGRARTRPRS